METSVILIACGLVYVIIRAAILQGAHDYERIVDQKVQEAKKAGEDLIRLQAQEREKLKALVLDIARPVECWRCENCNQLNTLEKSNCTCGFPRLDAKQYGAKQ